MSYFKKFYNKFYRITDFIWKILLIRYSKLYNEGFIERIFENKTIAIIGPADTALQQNMGEYIDKFDIIIRINIGLQFVLEHNLRNKLGSRTDVLFRKFSESKKIKDSGFNFDLFEKHNLKYLIFPSFREYSSYRQLYKILNMYSNKFDKIKIFILSKQERLKFKYKINLPPNNYPTTGFMALFSVLNSNFKECYITGFTFFNSDYSDNYRQNDISNYEKIKSGKTHHNPKLELEVIQKIITDNKGKVILDDYLNNIFRINKK